MAERTTRLPPEPRLPGIVQTAWMARDPVGFLERCRARLGPIFRIKLLSFPDLVYVAEPELARQVYLTDRGAARAGEVRREFLGPLVGEHSLLSLEGEEWLRHRKLLGPALHGGHVERYREQIAAIAAGEAERFPRGEPFELRPHMQAITLEVILRLVFGISDAERLGRMRSLLPPLLEGPHWLALWVLPPAVRERLTHSRGLGRILPRNPLARFHDGVRALDRIVLEEIGRRRGEEAAGDDVLSVLLASRDEDGEPMGDGEVRDELVTLLTAGHETTATALAWAFERLMRTPAALSRLLGEIDGGGDEYLDAVVKETLRARPVVIDTPRLLDESLRLDGYEVPAGWYVAPAIPLVQRDTRRFPDRDEFRPERFLGDDAPLDAWIPFGGGRRRCVGSHLAMLELSTVIVEVLRRVSLEPAEPSDERQVIRHVTLVPSAMGRATARDRERR